MTNNTAIILILLSIGLFYTFTSGEYKKVKDLSAQVDQYEGVLESATSIATLRDSLLTTYSSIPRTDIERIQKVLPENVDTMQMALDLDGIASRYGISLKSIKTSTDPSVVDPNLLVLPEYDTTVYKKANVSFSFIATYPNFKLMMGDVEKSLRLMDIKSVSFQATSETGLNEYQVTADTYWLK